MVPDLLYFWSSNFISLASWYTDKLIVSCEVLDSWGIIE